GAGSCRRCILCVSVLEAAKRLECGSLLRFLEGLQWPRAMPKRRQAGRTPNASRNSETFGTSRQRLECAELAPAFWRDSSGRGRCQSAGKPDAVQTLRGTRRHLARRASVWSARSLLPLFGGTAVVAGDAKAPASRTQSKRFAPFYRAC